MNTLSHATIGATIALVTKEPLIALPLAFASHFVADTLPHFGYPGGGGYGELFKRKLAIFSLGYDVIGICILLVLIAEQPWWVFAAVIFAVSPDFMWAYRYFWHERKGRVPPSWRIVKFHQGIQWFEKPIGLLVEVPLSIVLLVLISRLV